MSRESDLFHEQVPIRVQKAMLRAAFEGCIVAHAQASEHGREWLVDAVPPNRRLQVESRLQNLVLGDGFTVSLERTNSSHYTKIESDRVVITAVTRAAPVNYVKPYRYRETLATPAQMDWLAEPIQVPPDGAKLFALFMYGGRHNRKYPQHARIAFPAPDGSLAPGTIDLMTLYPDVVNEYVPETTVEVEPQVTLRRKGKAEGG